MNEPNQSLEMHERAACHPASAPATGPSGRALRSEELEFLLAGNRLSIRLPTGDTARLAFDAAGHVRAEFPDGSTDGGTWAIEEPDGYCIRWEKGPARSCTHVFRTPDELRLIDADGRLRGTIAAILPGA